MLSPANIAKKAHKDKRNKRNISYIIACNISYINNIRYITNIII